MASIWLLVGAIFIATPHVGEAGERLLRDVVDAEISAVWEREKIAAVEGCDDATFLRRVSLDLCGIIPTAAEAAAFIDDPSPEKRSKLIDRLLEDARYGVHQADEWDMLYFGRNPPGYDAPKREGFKRWLRDAFTANMPYNEIARALLEAKGNTAEQGATMYLLQYDRHPEDAAVAISQTFLGVQLQCARCHDHPYEAWTQRDFYGMAAFFTRLQRVSAGKIKLDDQEFDKIYLGELHTGEVKFTGTAKEAKPGQEGEPISPKFLLADTAIEEPDFSAEYKNEKRIPDGTVPPPPKFSRKDRLAEWVTSAENPYFAKASVNRIWAQFMGRGLVHPVDNMSASNPPTHPALLDAMTREFVTRQFDMKWLIREILNSRTYQLTSNGDLSEERSGWFERARTRPLSAEELLESWRVATSYDVIAQRKPNQHKGRFYGVTFDYLRRFFGEPNNGVGDFQGGLQEHLYLNNGELGRIISSEPDGLLDQLMKSSDDWSGRIDRLYLAVLSRRPSDAEREQFVAYCNTPEQNRQQERLREAIWVLMTCSEFRFNH